MAGSVTELIKEKLDIVEFLRSYLNLQPAGRNFKALCPFHKEKTPSFMVSPERQTWHCFGCNNGGDIFSFVTKYENIEFGEALRTLAEKAGVELKRLNPAEYKFSGLLYELQDKAKEFFKKQLKTASVAQKYLKDRGLRDETIEEFEIGWAPTDPDSLNLHLLNLGYDPDDVIRAGLSIKTEHGMKLDRFRGRIMFPIHNHLGKIVGFTGRILPSLDKGDMGKYVNSPETAIFNKSKLLYGFWASKNFIRETGAAFLVEGQMDFLMSWQAGVKNVIASSGTALTQDHLRAIRRLTDNLVVSFDNDSAGMEAGERAIDLAEAADFAVKVVTFKDFKDPAEMAEKDPNGLVEAVKNARPAPEFYFEKYLGKGKIIPGDRKFLNNLRMVLGKIQSIASPVERNFWIKELSKRTAVEEKVLAEEAVNIKIKEPMVPKTAETQPAAQAAFSRRQLLSQEIVSAAVAGNDFSILEEYIECLSPDCRTIFAVLKTGGKTTGDQALDEVLNLIMLRSGEWSEADLSAGGRAQTEIEQLKYHLTKEYAKDKRRNLTTTVKTAEAKGDENSLQSALQEFDKLPVI